MIDLFLPSLCSILDMWGWTEGSNPKSVTYIAMPAELCSQTEKENKRWLLAKKVWLTNDTSTLWASSGKHGGISGVAKPKFQLIYGIQATPGMCVSVFASIIGGDISCLTCTLLIIFEICHFKIIQLAMY